MKLATLRTGKPDGELLVVSRDLTRMCRAGDIAPTLQAALDDWARVKPLLAARYQALIDGEEPKAEAFDPARVHSPLPRAYQWCDGSVFPAHNERMAKWIKKPIDSLVQTRHAAPVVWRSGASSRRSSTVAPRRRFCALATA